MNDEQIIKLWENEQYHELLPILKEKYEKGCHDFDPMLAVFFAEGLAGIWEDETMALNLMTNYIENGGKYQPGIYTFIGDAYSMGLGTMTDPKKAEHYYKLAIDAGELEAAYALGYLYYAGILEDDESHSQAKKYLSIIAESKDDDDIDPDYIETAKQILQDYEKK